MAAFYNSTVTGYAYESSTGRICQSRLPPKHCVDSERALLPNLRLIGYEISANYDDADLVVVNTVGLLICRWMNRLGSIGEAIAH